MDYYKTKPRTVIGISRIVTIHYYEYGPSFSFPGESHDFWEMVYIDKGSVEVSRDRDKIILRQGEVVFHRPNEFHAIRALDSSPNFFVVSFVCASPVMRFFEGYQTRLDRTLKAYVSSIIREAEETYVIPKNDTGLLKLDRRDRPPFGGEQLIKTYLEQLLIFLLRAAEGVGREVYPQKENASDPLAEALKQYLEVHAEEVVRIHELCDEFGYSRSFLSRRFLEKTGCTLADYALQCRIDRAKQLIREGRLNFAQISARLSFENPQYFSRVFKRRTGMTPTEFKNSAHI